MGCLSVFKLLSIRRPRDSHTMNLLTGRLLIQRRWNQRPLPQRQILQPEFFMSSSTLYLPMKRKLIMPDAWSCNVHREAREMASARTTSKVSHSLQTSRNTPPLLWILHPPVIPRWMSTLQTILAKKHLNWEALPTSTNRVVRQVVTYTRSATLVLLAACPSLTPRLKPSRSTSLNTIGRTWLAARIANVAMTRYEASVRWRSSSGVFLSVRAE
ncbi:hypothetical protein DAEQUDRAFT_760168 [Daedalea quercina L-15889]|uniref:Uncharacterized protein n=1 Tax=Daedalea quercina L-15889 TaxID=1314783 RepID=A0A165L7K6_9APHY|nr:hypothetical protein DAEQUDRAFT_760168 [Daedalea quercina L-15889]